MAGKTAAGWKQRDIATALGVTEGAVSQWLKEAREGGEGGRRPRGKRGVKPRLSAEQGQRLVDLLGQGASHFGFGDAVWTQARVAWLIEKEFGVRYHPAHVGRILKQFQWSRQKPVQRASQRDEQAIGKMAGSRKKARLEGWTVIFIDESGFYLLRQLSRLTRRVGNPPHLAGVPLSWDHLSVIGALTWEGQVVMQVQQHTVKSGDIVAFLRQLLAHFSGKLLVIWDGLPAHRSQAVKTFLRQEAEGPWGWNACRLMPLTSIRLKACGCI